MKKNKQVLDIYFVSTENYTIRREQRDGKENIIVPVTMMVEGVHTGSHGPILHLAEELGKYPESWDGMPATIGHPKVNGQYVSANSPEVLQDWAVGRIFNTQMPESALNAEVWLDEENLERVSEETLNRLNNGDEIEVSVGIFSDEDATPGTWNTEDYDAIARNHRPDHLALLPDEIGACSIVDGCGIRVNKKGEIKVANEEKVIINSENQSQVLKELNRLGFSVNEVGYSEIREKIAQVVYGFDGNNLDHYVEEIYSDYFVYNQSNWRVEPRIRKLYKQSYSIDSANNVELSGEAIQVKREISYDPVVVTNRVVTKRVIKKNNSMCTDCIKKLADGLIANKATAWGEDDREYLEAQTEEQLEKFTPSVEKKVEVNTAKATREDILAVLSEKSMTTEEFMKMASPEVAANLQEGMDLRNEQKTEMVSQIVANTEEWTEEQLNAKELGELQKLHKVVMKDVGETVYVGGGPLGGHTKVNNNKTAANKKMLPNIVKQEKE